MPQHQPSEEIQPENKFKSLGKTQLTLITNQIKQISWVGIWNLALLVGGFFLFTYFASIGFLPDLDLKALTGTIIGVAIMSLFVVALVGFGLMLPAIFLMSLDYKNNFFEIAKPLYGISIAYISFINLGKFDFLWTILLLCVLFSTLIGFIYLHVTKWSTVAINRTDIFLTFVEIILWGIWAVICPMFYYSLLTSGSSQKEWEGYFYLILFTLTLAFVSIGIIKMPISQRPIWYGLGTIFSVFFLCFVSNRPTFIPQVAINALGLSVQGSSITLVLTETGCDTIKLTSNFECTHGENKNLGTLSDVKIISRIGEQFVISQNIATSDNKKQTSRRIVLRKEDVISWAYDYSK